MNTLWFFLPGIIYLGIATSYTDIRHGKIKNRDVVIGIAYAFVVYIGIIIYTLVRWGSLDYHYFLEIGSNTVFALSIAFGLWYYKIWSAGDGKLFFAFALLLPPEVYFYGRYNWVPSVTLLFNVFLIGLLAMAFLIVKNARWVNYRKMFKSFFKNFFEPKKLFGMIVSLFAVFWLVQIALSWVGLGNNLLLRYFLTMLVMYMLPSMFSRFSQKKSKFKIKNLGIYVMVVITILRMIVDRSVYSLEFLWSFIILIFVWWLIRSILREGLQSLGKDLFAKEISVRSLTSGMILSDKIIQAEKLSKKELKKLIQNEIQVISKGKFSYILGVGKAGKDYLDTESEGLTKEQIKKINGIGFKKVRISTTVPFAPLLFLGVIATLLIKGNILILRYFLFR